MAKEFNVWIVDTANGAETQLSTDGRAGDAYSQQFAWSPDSRKLVAVRVEAGQARKLTLVESSPKDQLQPKVSTHDYFKPGDQLPHPRPRLFDLATRRVIPISDALFPNPFTESGNLPVRWSGTRGGSPFPTTSAATKPSASWPWKLRRVR